MRVLVLWMFLACSAFAQTETLAAKFKQAQTLQSQGRTDEALTLYRELAQADAGNPALLVHVALAHYEAGKYPEAARWSNAAIQLRKGLAPAWLFAGAANLGLGRFETAVSQLRQALQLKPGDRNAQLMLAEALLASGKHTEAVSTFREAAALLPDNARAWYGLARSADALCSATDKGSEDFCAIRQRATARLDELPPSAHTHAWAGHRLYTSGRARESVPEWQSALELSPNDAGLKVGLVLALIQLREHERALPVLERAVQIHPQSSELHYLHGLTLLNLARPAEAIPPFRAALELNQRHLGAHAALGHALLQTGRAQDAISHLQAALPMDGDGVQHYQLARAYMLTGQRQAASSTMKKYQQLRRDWEQRQRGSPSELDKSKR